MEEVVIQVSGKIYSHNMRELEINEEKATAGKTEKRNSVQGAIRNRLDLIESSEKCKLKPHHKTLIQPPEWLKVRRLTFDKYVE